MIKFCRLEVLVLAFALVPVAAVAQERGTVAGTVTEVNTQRPLPGVQVMVAGTQLGTLTNSEGRYIISNVPVGEREVRATLIGYGQATRAVVVEAGGTATADFQLQETAIALEGLYVTATGAVQRRRQAGNVVGSISTADVEMAAVSSVADLLTARTPGLTVQSAGGTTGTSQRIRIRGSNSVSLSNEPLVIIDGVRINNSADAMSIARGGQTTSRLNDLNPEEIERIEVLKGPSAAAMYGTAAANGVIQITTRRGRAGAPIWNLYTEGGYIWDPTDYPANYGRRNLASSSVQCTLFAISTGTCAEPDDELLVFSPMEAMSPFRNGSNLFGLDRAGSRNKVGASVTGGSDALAYFFSGDRENERGMYPNNDLGRTSLRGNVSVHVTENLDLAVTTSFVDSNVGLPTNDNDLNGQISGALLGRPVDDENLRGYAGSRPDQIQQRTTEQGVRRFTGGIQANYRPLPWLSLVAQQGLDALAIHDQSVQPAETVLSSAINRLGFRESNRAETVNINSNLGATASYRLSDRVTGETSAGIQYQREQFERTDALGRQLLPGTSRLPGTSAQFQVNEEFTDNRTIGAYLMQQFGLADRVFLTAALRGDDNSAFGSDFGLIVYPSVSASWVVAEEPWFPAGEAVTSVRLRTAFGTSGLRPSFRDAITFFEPVGATVDGQDVPAFTMGGLGDPNLKPEFSTEYELGLDAGFLKERVGIELTYYDKHSRDALVFRRLAPSVGAAQGNLGQFPTGRFENVGSVSNRGWEVLLTAHPVSTPAVTWRVTGSLSTNRNRLVELGEGIEPIIFGLGSTQRHVPGFPVGGYWHNRLIDFEDANGDGIIQHTEVVVSDTAEFLGSPNPTREFAVSTSATFFDRFRLAAQVDGKGGHVLNNSTRYFRCASAFVNCREAFDPTAPLEDQARAIAATQTGHDARGVYFEDASFVKLRELALTFMAPRTWSSRLGVQGLSLTVAGRNLHTWTDYTGFDPEMNFAGGANQTVSEFLTQPPVRQFTTRIDLSF
jgi:TonB-dependent starch-binding outer membrane protein SusC